MKSSIDIKQREEAAAGFFRQGYNCCQSVMLAFSDVTGLPDDSILKISSGLGGGMGRMREVCGTVSAMTVISGFLSPATDPAATDLRRSNYALVQEMAGEFRKKNGSIVCRELLQLRTEGWQKPDPSVRTASFYHSRPCEGFVRDAARILAGKLSESNEKP